MAPSVEVVLKQVRLLTLHFSKVILFCSRKWLLGQVLIVLIDFQVPHSIINLLKTLPTLSGKIT